MLIQEIKKDHKNTMSHYQDVSFDSEHASKECLIQQHQKMKPFVLSWFALDFFFFKTEGLAFFPKLQSMRLQLYISYCICILWEYLRAQQMDSF